MKIKLHQLAEVMGAIIKDKVNTKVEQIGREIFDQAVEHTPVISGRLKDGWEMHVEEKNNLKNVIIQNQVPYAGYVEFGTDVMEPRLMLTNAIHSVVEKHAGDKL